MVLGCIKVNPTQVTRDMDFVSFSISNVPMSEILFADLDHMIENGIVPTQDSFTLIIGKESQNFIVTEVREFLVSEDKETLVSLHLVGKIEHVTKDAIPDIKPQIGKIVSHGTALAVQFFADFNNPLTVKAINNKYATITHMGTKYLKTNMIIAKRRVNAGSTTPDMIYVPSFAYMYYTSKTPMVKKDQTALVRIIEVVEGETKR